MAQNKTYDFYEDAYRILESQKPQPSTEEQEAAKRRARLSAVAEGLRTLGEFTGSTLWNAPVEKRQPDNTILRNVGEYNRLRAEDMNREREWGNRLVNLKMRQAEQKLAQGRLDDQNERADENRDARVGESTENRLSRERIAKENRDARERRENEARNRKNEEAKTKGEGKKDQYFYRRGSDKSMQPVDLTKNEFEFLVNEAIRRKLPGTALTEEAYEENGVVKQDVKQRIFEENYWRLEEYHQGGTKVYNPAEATQEEKLAVATQDVTGEQVRSNRPVGMSTTPTQSPTPTAPPAQQPTPDQQRKQQAAQNIQRVVSSSQPIETKRKIIVNIMVKELGWSKADAEQYFNDNVNQ